MSPGPKMLLSGLVGLAIYGALSFIPAWTIDYWQAWALLAVMYVVSTCFPAFYLMRRNPAALERRLRGGPTEEGRSVQKGVMAGLWLAVGAQFVVSALDHRFGWSRVPTAVCVVGLTVAAAGLFIVSLVIIQNSYAAAVVRVEEGQTVVSTGLYGLMRHPMYTGNLLVMIGIPLALGSYWGLIFVILFVAVITVRIRDEEGLLRDELQGYQEYTQKVRYRLVPGMW
ncbi:methyltransferase family protein [Mycobacterium sp. NPDC050041]|uniref:methyltransferase family protein n=1 Tax=Mycobacterium sp. NPDC050041 TaxID=3364293 RepID=UPI003C2AF700